MKLGLLSACMPERSLEEVAAWAGEHGFEALELAAWPRLGDRPFVARHVAADEFDEAEAERVRTALYDNGLELSALAYYDNNLHPDLEQRREIHDHLRACVDATAALGGPSRHLRGPRQLAQRRREPARGRARLPAARRLRRRARGEVDDRELRLEGWHPDGYPGNLAYSPELWEWMFELGLWLNFDPSHLLWIGIEPIAALRPYVDRVVHAHAKDAETFLDRRNRFGFFGRLETREADPWDMGWWRFRIPGLGQVDWRRYVDALYEGGFDGVLSVEHEDPVWGGSPEKVQAGLEIAQRNLRPLLV